MFLTKAELKTISTVQIVDLITNNDDTTVDDVIAEAIDLMKNYLFKYYDVDAIFNAVDGDRSKTVLRHLKSLVITDLYFIRKKDPSEGMEKRYDEAMTWLEKLSTGNISADLPRKQEDTDGDGNPDTNTPFMKLGSRKTYPNHF